MSETNSPPEPRKDGGLKSPPEAQPSEEGRTGGESRDADDVEREDSPGGRDGGMIDEG